MKKEIIIIILGSEVATMILQWILFREFAGNMWVGFNWSLLLYWIIEKVDES